jgi:hypothetical protein
MQQLFFYLFGYCPNNEIVSIGFEDLVNLCFKELSDLNIPALIKLMLK